MSHRGTYAFVEFTDTQSAASAITEMSQRGEMRVQKAYSKSTGTASSGGNFGGQSYDKDKYVK